MKKVIKVLVVCGLLFSLAACGNDKKKTEAEKMKESIEESMEKASKEIEKASKEASKEIDRASRELQESWAKSRKR